MIRLTTVGVIVALSTCTSVAAKDKPPTEPMLYPAQFMDLRRGMTEDQVRSILGRPSSVTVPVANSAVVVDKSGYCLTYRRVVQADPNQTKRYGSVDTWHVAMSNDKVKAWGIGSSGSNDCHYYFEMKQVWPEGQPK